jgi:hypothetical protein
MYGRMDCMSISKWFNQYQKLDRRFETFKKALELAPSKPNIIETGCARFQDDWSDGMSTFVFSNFVREYGGKVTSVDISKENIEMCSNLCKGFDDVLSLVVSDSVEYLKCLPPDTQIDLLYLDSYDYPYGKLLEFYGGKEDLNKAIKILSEMHDNDICEKHEDIIHDSQQHCLNEVQAALPLIHDRTVILIDDSDLPGGGKPGLAKRELEENGYICVMNKYQSLWTKEKVI